MKKKCIAIAKKAMVWAMAASMLVATPLTASAEGLNDVFKIEDQWGNNVDENGNKTDVIHGNSNTGTVTSTGSRSAVLDNEPHITGISLNTAVVNLELDGAYDAKKESDALSSGKLTAGNEILEVSILTEGEVPEKELDKLFKSLTWKSSDPSVVSFKNWSDGTTHDKLLSAKAGGDATITVSLDHYDSDIHYTATANVHVKQYASSVKFDFPKKNDKGEPVGYLKHNVDLNDVLVKVPETANDDIIFEIVETNPNNAATIKGDVVSYKKTGSVKVVAVPEKAAKAEETVMIEEGNPATKIDVKVTDTDITKKTTLQVDKQGVGLELNVVLYTKKSGNNTPINNREECTDDIVWSSKKSDIVAIDGSNKGDSVKLVAKGVGSSTITATASAGKKGTFNVTVKADMTGIEIVPDQNQDLYGGQTLELKANTVFEADKLTPVNPNAKAIAATKNFDPKATLKWAVDKSASDDNGKYATVKGNVLTLKPQVKVDGKVVVTVQSTKKYGMGSAKKNIVPASDPKNIMITMKQADVRKIVVTEGKTSLADTSNKQIKGTVTIAAGKNKTVNVVAYGPKDENGEESPYLPGTTTPLASTLNWASSSTKLATVKRGTETGTIFAVNKGKPTITVSGTTLNTKNGKYVAIKTTFKANVTQPSKTIKISTKTNVIKATDKPQTVKYTVTLDKGSTSKANDVDWMVYHYAKNAEGKYVGTKHSAGKLKGSIKLERNSYKAGDWFEITATSKDKDDKSSVSATATIAVVTPSLGVEIRKEDGSATFDRNKVQLTMDGVVKIQPMVNVGANKANPMWIIPNAITEDGSKVSADVTYTVSKRGIIYVKDGEIHRIKKGTVKLTATTSDGKKATLTITD